MSAEFRVRVEPGDGVVARFGPIVAVIAGEVSQPARELLELLERLGHDGEHLQAQRFLREMLARLAQAGDAPMPAIGAVALLGDDLGVVLHGDMECRVRKQDEEFTLRGRDAAVSLNVVLDGPFSMAALHPEGAEPGEEESVYQLTAGVVPGAAAVATPLPPREGEWTEPETAEVADAQLAPPQPDELEPPPVAARQRAPLPTAAEEAAQEGAPADAGVLTEARAASDAAELVDGIECSEGHFNHPHALTCSVCGQSLLDSARHTVQGPRQRLGTLTVDDGTSYDLVRNYVIGREPEQDPAVQAQQAAPVRLEDPEHLISRVHADVRLVGWDVQVVDRGSANGTFVLPPEASEWQRLGDEPRTISPGTRVAVGRKVITYEL